MTVSVYLNQWLTGYCEMRLAENTVRGYKVNVQKHIIPHIGTIELTALTAFDVQQMYTALFAAGLSSTTVLYVHAVLRRAINCALRQRLVTENVLYGVYAPRRVRYRGGILTGAELVKLVAACVDTDVYIPVLLAATLGLRRGEILGLKWTDIDFSANTIHIQRTATFYKDTGIRFSDPKSQTSNRSLLVSHYVMCRLAELYDRQALYAAAYDGEYNPLGLVNCRPAGQPLTSSMLQKIFKSILRKSGLPVVRFHDLRHSNATLMLKNKVPAKIVSSMFGHASVGITLDLYSHVLTDMQEPAVQVIDSLFK